MRAADLLPAVLLLALVGCGEGASGGDVEIGEPAPAYAAATLAGDTVTLTDLRGAPALLNVWATWCEPCRQEMPDLQALADEFSEEGLQVVGVSIDQAGATPSIRRFIEEYGIGFRILHDPRGRVTRVFRTIGVPETFLLDEDGILRARWIGTLPPEAARAAVGRLLDGRAPRSPPSF